MWFPRPPSPVSRLPSPVPMPSSAPEFLRLQRALLGRFSLVRELGRGGMGIVFLARDVALDRNVAIKLLPPQLAALPDHRDRFLREARLAAGLSHPHIVPIHLVDVVDDLVFFVMGYIDGETLGERIRRRGPSPVDEVIRIVQQVSWALGHAHARGIVHRDVKPDNILLERDSGRAVVSDFGIAGAAGAHTPADGVALGTPLYLSPEQAGGARGDARSDLYALGVTAWFALTGHHPHQGVGGAALMLQKATQPAPSLRALRPDLPRPVAEAIDRSLAMDPAARWPDGESLALHLERLRGRRAAVPARVRTFVMTTMPLASEIAAAATASLSALGMMAVLSRGGLIDAMYAQALALPIVALSLAYAGVRAGQSALLLMDVVRDGHDHDTVARALLDEEREQQLDLDARAIEGRRRDAWWYGSLGAVKTAALLLAAGTSLPEWITVPAALGAVIVPTVTVLKVWQTLRPGPRRWPRLLRGRLGAGIMRLMQLLTRRSPARSVDDAPTVTLLGGAIEALFVALPEVARGQLADLPVLARGLQREAARAAAIDDDAARERAASIATALETLRLELLSLQAGLHDVPEVTRHLEEARRVGERVDAMLLHPEATPL